MSNNVINSKSEKFQSVASAFVDGLRRGVHQGDIEIQTQISDKFIEIPKYPFEFAARIGGPSLTKLRKL
ncbi:hypothetical protein [Enterococcus faecium]|uniref:hypothetical protein n=1 Tax=Enterococcus TaxID=1350 RepID=UPI0009C1A68D|nr:hypothetical protein [Enterococcus faecium]EJC3744243.1 hypothetical protein [Enterococcus faecium]OQO65630.1 hypothetical protein BH743_06050 [Enterococcus faecium]OTN79414.1 hypothetical protein A5826_000026 [Enterococcus faecium]